jgi:DNA repair exonuclease SbcCD ATPase subunit
MNNEEVIGDDESTVDGVDQKDKVSYEAYKRLLSQRKSDQEKLKSAEERLKELDNLKEEKLRSEGNWKALLDAREQKLAEYQEQLENERKSRRDYEEQFIEAAKLNKFQDALGGKLKHEDYFNLVDTSKIAVDPQTGKIDRESVSKYASEWLKAHKELVQFSKPKINDNAPRPDGSAMSEKVKKMTPAELADYIKSQASAGKLK